MNTLTLNIITIVAEVVLVCISFFLLDWSFGKLYRQLFKISILEKFKNKATIIRRNVRGFILLIAALSSIAIIGFNGYLTYQGENVRDYSLQMVQKIPKEFWIALGLGILKSIGVIIATSITLRLFNPMMDKASKYAQDFDDLSANDESIEEFFNALKSNINSAAWIAIAILCAQFLILPAVVTKYLYILLKIYLIIALGLLIIKVVVVIIDSLDALSVKNSSPDNLLRFYDKLRHLVPFLKSCLEYIIYLVMATLVLQQLDFVGNLAEWGPKGIELIAIVFLSQALIAVAYLVVEELFLHSNDLTEIQQKRRETITPLIQNCSKYLIYFGAGIFMLDTIGVDPGPILAGAGILGLAVGLGAQNLINDIVSGFFILFENYYLVGDYIETDDASGYVEAIELRTTRIRHHHGQVYIVRNGDIAAVTNFSKDYVFAAVDIGIDYDSDLERVYAIIEAVGCQLQDEIEDVLEPTQVEGIEEFGDIRLSIHTKTKVKPGKHLRIERILRRIFKEEFDREGIYIPIGETSDKPEWVTQSQNEEKNQVETTVQKKEQTQTQTVNVKRKFW